MPKHYFQRSGCRHVELSKNAVLVTWPLFACDSAIQRSHTSAKMAPRYNRKTIFNMSSIRHLEFAKFWRVSSWCKYPHPNTKFDRNRIIHGWDMKIKLFSKWRPSAILSVLKLPFMWRDLYLHVILHLRSKFRINRQIWRRDIAKKQFSIMMVVFLLPAY